MEPTNAQIAAAWLLGYMAEAHGAGDVALTGPAESQEAFNQGRTDRRQEVNS